MWSQWTLITFTYERHLPPYLKKNHPKQSSFNCFTQSSFNCFIALPCCRSKCKHQSQPQKPHPVSSELPALTWVLSITSVSDSMNPPLILLLPVTGWSTFIGWHNPDFIGGKVGPPHDSSQVTQSQQIWQGDLNLLLWAPTAAHRGSTSAGARTQRRLEPLEVSRLCT